MLQKLKLKCKKFQKPKYSNFLWLYFDFSDGIGSWLSSLALSTFILLRENNAVIPNCDSLLISLSKNPKSVFIKDFYTTLQGVGFITGRRIYFIQFYHARHRFAFNRKQEPLDSLRLFKDSGNNHNYFRTFSQRNICQL